MFGGGDSLVQVGLDVVYLRMTNSLSQFCNVPDLLELRASCQRFQHVEPRLVLHSVASLLNMLENGGHVEKLRACKCLSRCDGYIGPYTHRKCTMLVGQFLIDLCSSCEKDEKDVECALQAHRALVSHKITSRRARPGLFEYFGLLD